MTPSQQRTADSHSTAPLRRPRLPVLIGIVTSLLVHQAVLIPLLVLVMTAHGRWETVQGNFHPKHFRKQPQPPDDVQLGLDEAKPTSTLAWIGYEEYLEHLAVLAEVDQAAFDPNPSVPAPRRPVTDDPAPPAEVAEADPTPADPTSPGEEAAAEEAEEALALLEILNEVDALQPFETGEKAPAAAPEAAASQPDRPQEPAEEARQPADDKSQAPTKSDDRKPVEAVPKSGETEPKPGDRADKESDPTSTVEVPIDNIRIGKPLAAHGLQLKPRRPQFTTLTQMTAAPRNPLCELRFRRDGKPQVARILQSSGDPRIDAAIRSSLYRWRATGKRLNELAQGKTVKVTIRIMLSPRRNPPTEKSNGKGEEKE